jgi:hypothetical protein
LPLQPAICFTHLLLDIGAYPRRSVYEKWNKKTLVDISSSSRAAVSGGFRADVRRVVASESFAKIFDPAKLGLPVTSQHPLSGLVPRGKKQRMVYPRGIGLLDRNGDQRECIGEAFDTKHQILILLRDNGPLNGPMIVIPGTREFQTQLHKLPKRL